MGEWGAGGVEAVEELPREIIIVSNLVFYYKYGVMGICGESGSTKKNDSFDNIDLAT